MLFLLDCCDLSSLVYSDFQMQSFYLHASLDYKIYEKVV